MRADQVSEDTVIVVDGHRWKVVYVDLRDDGVVFTCTRSDDPSVGAVIRAGRTERVKVVG